jgi:hypothetical protein
LYKIFLCFAILTGAVAVPAVCFAADTAAVSNPVPVIMDTGSLYLWRTA